MPMKIGIHVFANPMRSLNRSNEAVDAGLRRHEVFSLFCLLFRIIGAALILAAVNAPARAEDAEPVPGPAWDIAQSALCTEAIAAAEHKEAVPGGLLQAIAKAESGRPVGTLHNVQPWPWTINADGIGYFFQSKPAAVAWAQFALKRGVRFMDIGCTQVDWQLHPGAFHSLEDGFDPTANAAYAAHFLHTLYDEAKGNWYVAAGLYHSHTPDLAAIYRDQVAEAGRGIARGTGEPLYRRAIRQGTLRLAMAGGHVLVVRTNRQPSRGGGRRSPCQVAAILRPLLAVPSRVAPCGRG
jgi:hypothetical protein